MYLLYHLALLTYALLAAPKLLLDAIRYGKYRGTLAERWGRLPAGINPARTPSIWIHAVSVGEVLATRALIPALRDRYPDHSLWLSTTTQTGRRVADRLTGVDGLFYFPLDLAPIVRRVLDQVCPALFVTVDTELWPVLLRECRRRGVKTVLVNGRVSNRSYPRYRLAGWFFRRVLADLDLCCAQSEEAGRRLVALGVPTERVRVTGNLKFDTLDLPAVRSPRIPEGVRRVFRMPEGQTVVIAASTHPGEEAPVLEAFAEVRRRDPGALLVLAPRHPERADEVLALAAARGHEPVRRTALPLDSAPRVAVVVLDTVGELADLFDIATVVFLGGSLVPHGGHNVLEPAVCGKPVVFGPHMQNFAEIAELFVSSRAACQIAGAHELATTMTRLLDDPVERASLGAAARALVDAHRGATDRSVVAIGALFPPTADTVSAVVMPFNRA